jgi:hypothetical protein
MRTPRLINFKRLAAEEWARLNRRNARQSNDVKKNLGDVFRESLASYFAPIRMTLWLLRQVKGWRG